MKLSTTTNLLAFASLLLGRVAANSAFLPEQEQLEKAQALWESSGIQHYQYQYTNNGMADVEDGHPFPWTIAVNQEEISGQDAQKAPIHSLSSGDIHALPTIEESFGLIQDQIELATAHEITVSYDPELGYPTTIYIHMEDDTSLDIENTHLVPLDNHISPLPSQLDNRQLQLPVYWSPATEQARYNAAKAQWDARFAPNYHYTYKYTKTAGPPDGYATGSPYPWTLTKQLAPFVVDADGKAINVHIPPSAIYIQAFWNAIQQQIDLNTLKQLTVSYDPILGYPTYIYMLAANGRDIIMQVSLRELVQLP